MVKRTQTTKLLGVYIDESQDWLTHYKSLRSALNQRLFIIRRVMTQIPANKILSIVYSLWVSKLRYGLQLCIKVLVNDEEKKSAALKSLQLTQNRMLRAINCSKIKDRISIQSMLTKFNLLSVNQLAAQIKLIEVWKSVNMESYAISLDPYKPLRPDQGAAHNLRHQTNRIFNDTSKFRISKLSFSVDAARLWNLAPDPVRLASTIGTAKAAILVHVKTLPI